MIDAVRDFLGLLEQSEPPTYEALVCSLDALAFAYHDTPHGTPTAEGLDPPASGYEQFRRRVEMLFPDYGLYGVADPLEVPNEKPLVGNAIDDLADIAGDLQKILWRWEMFGADDANWHFRLSYQIHWGRHLHELRLYLHAMHW